MGQLRGGPGGGRRGQGRRHRRHAAGGRARRRGSRSLPRSGHRQAVRLGHAALCRSRSARAVSRGHGVRLRPALHRAFASGRRAAPAICFSSAAARGWSCTATAPASSRSAACRRVNARPWARSTAIWTNCWRALPGNRQQPTHAARSQHRRPAADGLYREILENGADEGERSERFAEVVWHLAGDRNVDRGDCRRARQASERHRRQICESSARRSDALFQQVENPAPGRRHRNGGSDLRRDLPLPPRQICPPGRRSR